MKRSLPQRLEQQRQELPVGESQQQLARQLQQQLGLPPFEFTTFASRKVFTDAFPAHQ